MARSHARFMSVFVAASCGAPLFAQVLTQRVNVSSAGTEANSWSEIPRMSADARYVVFSGAASNLVAADANSSLDVFVRDRHTPTTERVSVSTAGVEGNGDSEYGAISGDGRFVAFESSASNLVGGDTNSVRDVFVRDRQTGVTERVSVDSNEIQADGASQNPSISDDGRYVVFESAGQFLVPGDTNSSVDVFLRDRQLGTTERISVSTSSAQGNATSGLPRVSGNGRYVVFSSDATSLIPGDTNGKLDVFLRDRQLGTTELISVSSSGAQSNAASFVSLFTAHPITLSGRYVAYNSVATNLVAGDTNLRSDVFLRDRTLGTTVRVSVSSGGGQAHDGDSFGGDLSATGQFVAFYSEASDLVPGDTNDAFDMFRVDLPASDTELMSLSSGGAWGDSDSYGGSLSADGRFVAYESFASNLVAGDSGFFFDVFVTDTNPTGFTGICNPGQAGVISCPCSNPPAGAERGCNNSSATGGARLTALGDAYLSADTLSFTTYGEKPTALSIVWQGPTFSSTGVVFGQGVRCVTGTLKRLYYKNALNGSITAPDTGSGDPTISARSATLGVPITAGQSRYYFVSYRDPVILGGCPSVATFNDTQAGRVDWSL